MKNKKILNIIFDLDAKSNMKQNDQHLNSILNVGYDEKLYKNYKKNNNTCNNN